MPAQKPVVGVARIAIGGAISGVPWVNIFHVRHEPLSAWSTATLQDLVDTVRASYVTRFAPVINSQASIGDAEVVDLSSELGAAAVGVGSHVGTMSGTGFTSQVAQCVTWAISRRYRGGHPRTYLPPPSTSATTGGTANTWSPTHVTNVNAAVTGFRNDVNTADYAGVGGTLVCVHRFRTEVTGEPPVILDPPIVDVITSGSVDTRVDSQRRRLGKDR